MEMETLCDDFIRKLATRGVAARATWAIVDRNARKGTGPSDHAPVIIDLAD